MAAQRKINGINETLSHRIMSGDVYGSSLAPLGDLDGNGVVDFAVGAYGDEDDTANDLGAAYIVYLNPDHTVLNEKKIGWADKSLFDEDDLFGHSMNSLGDLDGNGVSDLVVADRTVGRYMCWGAICAVYARNG